MFITKHLFKEFITGFCVFCFVVGDNCLYIIRLQHTHTNSEPFLVLDRNASIALSRVTLKALFLDMAVLFLDLCCDVSSCGANALFLEVDSLSSICLCTFSQSDSKALFLAVKHLSLQCFTIGF